MMQKPYGDGASRHCVNLCSQVLQLPCHRGPLGHHALCLSIELGDSEHRVPKRKAKQRIEEKRHTAE